MILFYEEKRSVMSVGSDVEEARWTVTGAEMGEARKGKQKESRVLVGRRAG